MKLLGNWLELVCSTPGALAIVLLTPLLATAQEDFEEESPYAPGLVATIERAGDAAASAPIVRIDESLAFDWEAAPPDPRLPAGDFTAVWRGRLWTQAPGRYELAVYADGGKVSLRLAGKEVLQGAAEGAGWLRSDPIELQFGRHALEVSFSRTATPARLALYWTGPNFVLEPIPARFLMRDREASPTSDFERGRTLAAALRCAACHGDETSSAALAAPALDKLSGHVETAWLIEWLAAPPAEESSEKLVRRMPHFALSEAEAADVAAWLTRLPAEKPPAQPSLAPASGAAKGTGKTGKSKSAPPQPSAAEGEQLFLTLGCLACHHHGDLGESGLFGGGDLTAIAAKRPAEFFARWLADPASLNRQHRMPVFDLSPLERDSLALWLGQQGKPANLKQKGNAERGKQFVAEQRCAACHALPDGAAAARVSRLQSLSAASDWNRSCASRQRPAAGQPRYGLTAADAQSLTAYYTQQTAARPEAPLAASRQAAGRDLLVELNCLACHAREGLDRQVHALPGGLEKNLAAVVARHDALGKQVPAMTPPALNAVGDKLTDEALANAIRREGKPHRPYLLARMPKFRLSDEQLAALAAYFTATDRIPSQNPKSEIQNDAPWPLAADLPATRPLVAALAAAGPRLVTTDGFGCTSCHQVGGVLPDKAPLNARGPDLSLLEKRIRREWFGRWCASPARIVPRMEMPSVQVPVRGVLGDKIDDQLAAVWHILNTPGFEPPEPNPVRVLRLSGVPENRESPLVLHDVIKVGDKTHLFPLAIGLPNRHNILYDLETGRLAAWWLGDLARQRTKGKSWFWEAGEPSVFAPQLQQSELSMVVGSQEYFPQTRSQFLAELESYGDVDSDSSAFYVRHRLVFELPRLDDKSKRLVLVRVSQTFTPNGNSSRGWRRTLWFDGVPAGAEVRLRLVNPEAAIRGTWDKNHRVLTLADDRRTRIQLDGPGRASARDDGSVSLAVGDEPATPEPRATAPPDAIVVRYETSVSADQYVVDVPPSPAVEASKVDVAPGFAGVRLPLPADIMPTGIAEESNGRLVFTSLKGQVFAARDTNGDGLHDHLTCLADGLPTPYGIYPTYNSLTVMAKTALVQVTDMNDDGRGERINVLASGWGVTDDYHDWAVGLQSIGNGIYCIALPCQQDGRSEAAARYRGSVLALVPERWFPRGPETLQINVISSGHRFPMGLARNSGGELFVTDNQGNYNPFNELNHVRPGAHFGFINALEKEKGYKPPRHDRPAVDIPHPWTRSVNGICFLETPRELLANIPLAERADHGFGPLEGHLVGCEYDTRALIRMTLQKVGDTYQGAAYPLSIPPDNVEDGLLGPIVCAVSPRGELYVGNIRDSGWGAGNNVGDIVRIKIEPEKLPCGIAEVQATSEGFTLDFFRPVERAKALDAANYAIASYRRESTPAYGGPNLDRRSENIKSLELSEDGKRVTLKLDNLRAGFLYEFQLKPLTRGKEPFHPAEAHYTLNRIP